MIDRDRRLLGLALRLCLTPSVSRPLDLFFGHGNWWLLGCIEGDQPLPVGEDAKTEEEALDAMENWLAGTVINGFGRYSE